MTRKCHCLTFVVIHKIIFHKITNLFKRSLKGWTHWSWKVRKTIETTGNGQRLLLLLNVSSGSYHVHYLNKLGEPCKLHPSGIRMSNSTNEVKYKIWIILFHYGFIVETQKYHYGQVTHTLLKTMSNNSVVII